MNLKKIGVIGAGQMGSGIAQIIASKEIEVIMSDMKIEFANKGYQNIEKIFEKKVKKGKMTNDKKSLFLSLIKLTTNLNDFSNVDFVIEAATENEKLKFEIFNYLDKVCKKDTILASNTSSIPIGKIASVTNRPEKIIGMHYMNPVPVIKLVEIIKCMHTSKDTLDSTLQLSLKLDKNPALSNDYPGFIANRILLPMINEAIFALYHGVGTKENIDKVMKIGMNHPMGPLELADLIGLDTCLFIMETLYKGFNDTKYRPCPLLYKYVDAGIIGRKVGKGFYNY